MSARCLGRSTPRSQPPATCVTTSPPITRFLSQPLAATIPPAGTLLMAGVGAHLSGQPLNWQLTQRDGRLVRTCRTHPDYKFYALHGRIPPKPGLVHIPGYEGPGIEVEIWALPKTPSAASSKAFPLRSASAPSDSKMIRKSKASSSNPLESKTPPRSPPSAAGETTFNRSNSGRSLPTLAIRGFNRFEACPSQEFGRRSRYRNSTSTQSKMFRSPA